MVDKFKKKVRAYFVDLFDFSKKSKLEKVYDVSIISHNDFRFSYVKKASVISLIALMLTSYFAVKDNYFFVFLFGLSYFIFIFLFTLTRFKAKYFNSDKELESDLKSFIKNNSYYVSNNGLVIGELDLAYLIRSNGNVEIIAYKNSDSFQKTVSELAEKLESLLNMPLVSFENDDSQFTRYVFSRDELTNDVITSVDLDTTDLNVRIDANVNIDYSGRKSANAIIAGSTGAGKSYLSYALLTSFLKIRVNKKPARLFVIDPKSSDLLMLCRNNNFPSSHYGSSNKDVFLIVKQVIEILESRKELYLNSGTFNSNSVAEGLPPVMLVIEEYSSMISSIQDKKSRTELESYLIMIAQQGRSLGITLTCILQQPSSSFLPTSIRNQLVNSFFMGTPSPEAGVMLFGNGADIPVTSGLGSGIYSFEKESPYLFYSPRFDVDNVFSLISPVWKEAARLYALDEKPEWETLL